MHFLTPLIIVAGFVFVVCLSLVKLTRELSEASIHEPPAIPETPGRRASPEELSRESFLDPQWTLPRCESLQEDVQSQGQELPIRVHRENGDLRGSPLR